MALDAVAAVPGQGPDEVVRVHCPAIAGDEALAHVAVLPRKDAVYVSGQAEKGDLATATEKTMASLFKTLDHMGLGSGDVVQLKAFMQPMAEAATVEREIAKAFSGQTAPPLVLVEWTSRAPIEIELIASAPPAKSPGDTVSHFTPPGVTASPVYSRVARVHGPKTIYISGLCAQQPGSGEEQIRDVFASLTRVLELSGGDPSLRHLVKATYYCADDESSTMLNKIRPEFYDPQRPPAASKAMVHGLAVPGRTFTMDMIAVTPGSKGERGEARGER